MADSGMVVFGASGQVGKWGRERKKKKREREERRERKGRGKGESGQGAGHRTATGGSPAPAPATARGGRKRWPWPTVAWWCSAQVGKWASGGRWLGLVGLGFLNAELRLMGWGSWASGLLFGLFCWYGPGKFGLLQVLPGLLTRSCESDSS
ncbi:uncharacterized protein [Gossypium hirsutum]|uniref:Uncharacterized protein n=1 Tax=Gossypium hirsutum TaxID=3635 RepID=A0ABM3A616_GOSHI|nr:uncharacterized protein LOC121217789 [Gossypium hirsutum]